MIRFEGTYAERYVYNDDYNCAPHLNCGVIQQTIHIEFRSEVRNLTP